MKTVKLNLNSKSIDEAIKEVENFQKCLEEKTKLFVSELAKEGLQVASVKFQYANYDGTNDVHCEIREEGDNKVAIVALGNAVLFIEFGTGVKYPDDHPEKSPDLVGRGEYGRGLGANPKGWFYTGEPGTNGEHAKNHYKTSYHTYGNPANMCMYATVQELKDDFEEIAKRVFTYD